MHPLRHGSTRFYVVMLVSGFLLCNAAAIHGQIAPAPAPGFQIDGTVSNAVSKIQSALLDVTGCHLPTLVYQSPDTKGRKQNFDGNAFHDTLMASLQLTADAQQPTTFYNAYVTRLFDTPSSNQIFGVLNDEELLGVVQSNSDPHAQFLWGVKQATYKYDCNSMMQLSSKTSATYQYLDLATLQASFNAARQGTATNSVIIVTGRAESLYDTYTNPAMKGTEQYLFAKLQAINWQEGPLVTKVADNDKRLNYLSSASIISFATT
jgi:hypothetical protein